MDNELGFEIDGGLIRVSGNGIWSPEQAATHFRNLERAVGKVRRDHGKVSVLVDLRQAAVQPSETAAIIHEETTRIYSEADRIAIVCPTALLALQMKRGVNIASLATFHEMEPALRWVQE
jgi:hypothetical protein